MINLKYQSGGLTGGAVGILFYKYLNLESVDIILPILLLIGSFIIWAWDSRRSHKTGSQDGGESDFTKTKRTHRRSNLPSVSNDVYQEAEEVKGKGYNIRR